MKAAASTITTVNEMDGLPAYRVKKSVRARNVNLTFSPVDGLTVVIPRGFDTALIPGLLFEHRPWIRKQFSKYQVDAGPRPVFTIPARIVLAATAEHWEIAVDARKSQAVRVREKSMHELSLTGPIDDTAAVQRALHRWLKRTAQHYLPGRLGMLASQYGLEYGRVTIRLQKSRWGSCSARGTISLNARLMFLEPQLVDHVLLHELCHTRHLDHSRAFWETVENFEPDYKHRRKLLATSWSTIPNWALSSTAG